MGMKKVLIVDDDPVSRALLSHICESLGYPTIQCSSVDHGWSVLHDNKDIALVLTDYQMPEQSGVDLVNQLRSHGKFAKLPVIMVSGVVTLKEISHLLSQGVDRFLPKPINAADLQLYVRHFMESSKDVQQSRVEL